MIHLFLMLFLVDNEKDVMYYIFIPTTTFLFFILLLLSNTPFPSAFSADGFFYIIFSNPNNLSDIYLFFRFLVILSFVYLFLLFIL